MINMEIFEDNYGNNWEDLVYFLNYNYIFKDQIIKIKDYDDKHGINTKIILIYQETEL